VRGAPTWVFVDGDMVEDGIIGRGKKENHSRLERVLAES